MAKKFASGRFIPQNPQKYVGKNASKIFFRSSWELAFMKWLDSNNAVLRWGSEELCIPYVSPLDGKVHKYYPDMIIMYLNTAGAVCKEIIEIKPHAQSVAKPKMSDHDARAFVVNKAKWEYAADWAERNGAKFRIITEKSMFHSASKKKAVGTSV